MNQVYNYLLNSWRRTLAGGGITPDEAGLNIGHGGRIDPRLPSIYERFRGGRINRSEAMVLVRQWRQRHQAG